MFSNLRNRASNFQERVIKFILKTYFSSFSKHFFIKHCVECVGMMVLKGKLCLYRIATVNKPNASNSNITSMRGRTGQLSFSDQKFMHASSLCFRLVNTVLQKPLQNSLVGRQEAFFLISWCIHSFPVKESLQWSVTC